MTSYAEHTALEIARIWVESYNSKDYDRYLSLFSGDAEVVAHRYGVHTRGELENRRMMEQWDMFLPDGRMDLISLFPSVDGRSVAVEVRLEGTVALGGAPHLPAVGERFTVRLCTVLQIQDGLICHEQDYTDTVAVDSAIEVRHSRPAK